MSSAKDSQRILRLRYALAHGFWVGRDREGREGGEEEEPNTNAELTSDLCHIALRWPSPRGVVNTSPHG